ncbi:hypothetical protein [Aureivirga marina]|uniref:hypothetical protein n=1 Tax=Aureivirga marina TaxID=1182451 RepID=UPI0018C8FF47|nr:hypothetical protein [Aureivirga marina]
MKFYVLMLFLIMTTINYAQSFETGSYFVSGTGIKKLEILKRKNGSLKAEIKTTNGNKTAIFKPIGNHENRFESKENRLVLTKYKGVLALLELDKKGMISNKFALGLTKKELKKGKKALGIKSGFMAEMKSLSNKKETIENSEFFVKNPTSKFHEENVGKIVFFSEKPEVGKEDISKIKTKFKVGDEIWAVAYLPLPLKTKGYLYDLTNSFQDAYGGMNYWACIGMDKHEKDLLPKENEIFNQCTVKDLTEKDLEKNYVVFQILTNDVGNNEMNALGAEFLLKRMSERLDNDTYKIRVALTNGEMKQKEEYFSGYFQFDASAGTEIYGKMSKEITQKILESKPVPTAVKKDANLEAEMLQQIRLWARNKNWSDVDFRKVIITLDWQILKDDYGNIEGKYIEGNVLYKSDEGCGHRNFGFIRKYQGGGQYDSYLKQYTTGPVGALSCDKVK